MTHGDDMTTLCECDFDPEYHRARNEYLGLDGDACGNTAVEDGRMSASPALCMACLCECAP